MRFTKALILSAILCSLSLSAFAEVQTKILNEKCAAGTFQVDVPKVVLQKSQARQNSMLAINNIVEKFRYQAESIGNTEVKYHVTAENDSYVSLLLESVAVMPDSAHPDKAAHAIVIDKTTGEEMPLSHFVTIPNAKYLRDQAEQGYLKVLYIDGQTELPVDIAKDIKVVPTEYILDRQGNVYLLATDMTIYATGTPLLFMSQKDFPDAYVIKG